jgi:hypothetical protein
LLALNILPSQSLAPIYIQQRDRSRGINLHIFSFQISGEFTNRKDKVRRAERTREDLIGVHCFL